MKHQHIDEKLLDSAIHEVEMEFRVSGMVGPMPGFLSRWQTRLIQQRIRLENRQAWIFVAIIVVIMLGFFALIGINFMPDLPTYNNLLSLLINLFTKLLIFIKMFGTIIETLFRTLSGLIPPIGWINAIVSTGVLLLLWIGLMRQFVHKQGVLV